MDEQRKTHRNKLWFSSILCVAAGSVAFFSGNLLLLMMDVTNVGHGKDFHPAKMTQLLNKPWIIFVFALALFIVTLVLSLVETGRGEPADARRYTWFDRIFAELQIASAFFISLLLLYSMSLYYSWLARLAWVENAINLITDTKNADEMIRNTIMTWYPDYHQPRWILLFFAVLLTVAIASYDLLTLQSIVKKMKYHDLWNHTMTHWILAQISAAGENLTRSTLLIGGMRWAAVVVACLVSSVDFLFIPAVGILAAIWFARLSRQYEQIRYGLGELKSGNAEYRIHMKGKGELKRLADDIDAIGSLEQQNIDRAVQSQQMRNALISNVAHDLKTPITSLVTYIDLLRNEDIQSDQAQQYLEILENKTQRLQKLTEDLFEASKASSGDLLVEIVTMDLVSMVYQALGELERGLTDQDIEPVVTAPFEHLIVEADGHMLWRILENLITNVSKYAQPHSRMYVDIAADDEWAFVTIKNVSRDPLNIDIDNLMERFVQGDRSRATDGSGLGLAIARDLAHLIGGMLQVSIDGDLFKAQLRLPRADRLDMTRVGGD